MKISMVRKCVLVPWAILVASCMVGKCFKSNASIDKLINTLVSRVKSEEAFFADCHLRGVQCPQRRDPALPHMSAKLTSLWSGWM